MHASGKEQRRRKRPVLRKLQQPCRVERKRGKRQATKRKDKRLVLQVRRIRKNNSMKKIQALWLNWMSLLTKKALK